MKQVQVEIKNVYGRELIYPRNREAEIFAKLLGQKTFTKKDLAPIKELGFEIQFMAPKVETSDIFN